MATKRAHRAHHEGSIYQRADGRWVACLTLGYSNGRRQRKTYYAKTQQDALAQLSRARHLVQQGLPITDERQTVGQFLTRWLEDYAQATVRPRTYASYAQLIRLHLLPELGRVPIGKLSPQHVQALLNRKHASGLSPRTVQYLHALLRTALNRAVKWGLVARNVALLTDPPRLPRTEIQPLTPEQVQTLLRAIQGDRLEALYTVAIALGLRQGEALGLRWQQVDLEHGTLSVSEALQRINGTLQLVELKTARSHRTLALPEVAVAILRRHQARQLEERLLAGDRWQEFGLVFGTRHGKPLIARNVFRSYQRTLQKAGLPHKRFYDLRHTCATLLLAQGVDPRTIMETLGHSQISLTMNTYAHVLPALQMDAARRMNDLLTTSL
jgi:integrase